MAESIAKPLFESNGIKATIVFTERENHAYELAQTLPFGGHDGVAVVGGDGTVHEVINGMTDLGLVLTFSSVVQCTIIIKTIKKQ